MTAATLWRFSIECTTSRFGSPSSVRSISSDAGASMFPLGVYSNGRPSHSTTGSTGAMRSGATWAVPAASATLVTILKPAQRPDAREEASALGH